MAADNKPKGLRLRSDVDNRHLDEIPRYRRESGQIVYPRRRIGPENRRLDQVEYEFLRLNESLKRLR